MDHILTISIKTMGFVKEFNMYRPTIYPVFDELSLDILFVISIIHRAYPYMNIEPTPPCA